MPIYEYRCGKCGSEFEQFRRIGDGDDDLKCPKCGQEKPERKLSATSPGGGSACGCGCGGGSKPSPPKMKIG